MKSILFLTLILSAATTSTAFAQEGFPGTPPHPPTAPPSEGPSTPVPMPPTDDQMYQYYVGQLTILYAQLQMAQTNLNLYRAILALDPTREDVLAVVRQFEAQVALIQIDIAIIQNRISLLNP